MVGCLMDRRIQDDGTVIVNGAAPNSDVITGEIKMWPTGVAPAGYFMCAGGTFDGVANPKLAALLGDQFGTHVGNLYSLPDFRGRSPLGAGTASPAVPGGTAHTIGQKGGEEKHTQTQAELAQHTHIQNSHNHSQQPHSHATLINTGVINARTAGSATYNVDSGGGAATALTTASNDATTATNQNTGSSTPFNVLNPFLGINFIIKAD
jgi:microcystin-dependent protein